MSPDNGNAINVLRLTLHDQLVGYLVGFKNGHNILSFDEAFVSNTHRPTLGLITHPKFPNADKILAKPWSRNHRLHPLLSSLLPEGALRELIAQGLKVHINNEFQMLAFLGADLPGALVAEVVASDEVPDGILSSNGVSSAVPFESFDPENKFSLAGVQMKFSMKERDGRYTLSGDGTLGDWIIKTPSSKYKDVPQNEFTAMTLASLAGVDIPEIKLVALNALDRLPPINLPDETGAFAIKRFDRHDTQRIHMEDFAQVLVKYPHQKYNSANYEAIGKVLYEYSGDGLADAQQFAIRLLVNILLANGDAHLKNWSLLYADQLTPRLSPAYDIVTTRVYIDNERHYALNMGKHKDWYAVNLTHFEAWATKAGIPWELIKTPLLTTLAKARDLWPSALTDLPMNPQHKEILTTHWRQLHADFRIRA